jgi:hypothetical protein
MLLMFISIVFIFLGCLKYILNIPYVWEYQCFWPMVVSLYRRICNSACRIGDS